MTRRSSARRSWFRRSIRSTIRATSSGASHSRSSAASREQPVRPPALIRGPSTKPRCSALCGAAQARRQRERREARIAPARRDLQPLGDQGAIEPGQRHHVAHGAERHQIEPAPEVRLGPAREMAARAERAVERHDDQERHPDRGQVARRAHLVAAVRVDHRECLRQALLGGVVIDHDHLQAALGGERQRLEGGGAAVERDHQPAALRGEALERLRIGAVALEQAIGHVDDGLAADRLQIAREQRQRGRAVDVVVAEQAHRLARDDRIGQPLDRAVEVVQMRGVGQGLAQPRLDEGRHAVEREAAAGQDPADHLGQLAALADGERQRWRRDRASAKPGR